MNIYLLIHNIGFIISALASIAVVCFLLLNRPRSSASIFLALTIGTVIVFVISHVVGVNIEDPSLSSHVLMLNISLFFIGAFNVHSVLAVLGKDLESWYMPVILYVSALCFSLWFILNPALFLQPSVPKMYFPNYYEPGILNWVRVAFLYGICVSYMLAELAIAYFRSTNSILKNQLRYLILGYALAYGLGFIPNFLVYDVPIDPLWGMAFMVFFMGPFVYGVVKYELFNIKIIAKQAFWYSVAVVLAGGLILLFQYIHRVIEHFYAGFPFWITPLASGVMIVTVAVVVWWKLREADMLKYEFVTIATHKLRTPLTRMRWITENLLKSNLSPNDRTELKHIQGANDKLVELTNLLANISEAENVQYRYQMRPVDLSQITAESVASIADQEYNRHIRIEKQLTPGARVVCDQSRIRFVIQTLIENAIHYTPPNGVVSVSTSVTVGRINFEVKDNGIGMSKDDLPFLFTKFHRGRRARQMDTEGLGIGLYVSKEIIGKHQGKIWARSEGEGKGSIFGFSLAAMKNSGTVRSTMPSER
ncbi:MAG: hypothetical protein A2849_02085 [Candidatus Taylorbacteria bacterium RIFCSPHIGHO2_01_FULL_51_15]|uniref:histidine kinase n=1 Tax=Candidatus Taylorbacteria bacterium RIFCSPHIGHO2_01_FULL_51_15 TaxID=1802304 RepID=A0A1G2MB45_9BACT|nr:MAG: hypothetical protein A2849_02085 [Candidatus Taylorbacteria bacterium RIFCSPHIGHO2_01_FULL_51_15]